MAAIICLTYAQTTMYNELSTKTILNRLKINHIPLFLFQSKIFIQHRHSLECTYKTKDPQSYFRNPKFLIMHAPAKDKIVYLKALSMRRVSDNNNFIPLNYYSNIPANVFTRIENDRIIFPLESSL